MPVAAVGSWLGLNGMNGCVLAETMKQGGGIPVNYTSSPNCAGTVTFNTIQHVWVKVTIGATVYEIDPSFKSHTQIAPSVNLQAVTGYDRAAFVAAACAGCNANPNIVSGLNRGTILNPANAVSYPGYAKALLAYLQSNDIHDLNKVIGGTKIDQIYPTSLPSTLPYTVVSRLANPFTIDGTWKAALLVNFNGISQLFSSDAIYGKRLTVTFDGGNFPQLNLDGTVVQTGTTAVPVGSNVAVNLWTCMPVNNANCSDGALDPVTGKPAWCKKKTPILCVLANVVGGGTYAITNSWGPVSHNMVQRHQTATVQAANAGVPPAAEAYLGEVLTTQGFSYSEQNSLYQSLSQDGLRNGGHFYYIVGISGHTGAGGGPYVDLPGEVIFPGLNPTLNGDGTYTPALNNDNFFDQLTQGSVLESTTVTQLTGVSSVSTAKLIDIGMALASNSDVYDFKTCADYNTYSPSLVSYTTAVKNQIKQFVCNKGSRVVLPKSGNLSDPADTSAPKWVGAGYYVFPTGSTGFSAMITGGYSGGYAGKPQPQSITAANVYKLSQLSSIPTAWVQSPVPSNGGSSGVTVKTAGSGRTFLSDPVDSVTGAFVNSSSDISVGEAGTEREISLERGYTTADISPSSPMGQGWKHSFDIWAQNGSDGVRPAGAYDAWDAAEMLVLKMINRDLLSDPALPPVNIAVTAVGNRWLGDRLVNNLVTASVGTSATTFHRLADDTYNPGEHSTARLTNTSGNWQMKDSGGTTLAFNAADTSGLARILTITQPTGIVTTFYYGIPNQLSLVSNNLGRKLNFNWTGTRITSVTDTPLGADAQRTVSFTYSGNFLQQVTDTRGGRTLYCYDGAGRMTSYYLPSEGGGTNCSAAGAHIVNVYDSLGRVKQQTDRANHITDLYLAGTRSEVVTHPGSGVADIRMIDYLDNLGNVTRAINPRTGLPTRHTYDAIGRLVRTDLPEGNAVEISYDVRSNPTRTCLIPKTAGGYPACDTSGGSTHIWSTNVYNEGPLVWTCAAINTCNSPASTTDPLGNVTSYSYYADGQIDTVTLPTPAGYAGAPRTVNSYTSTLSQSGYINLLTQRQVTATTGAPPSIVTTFGYDTAANGLTLKTTTLDPAGLNYTSSFGYDGYGNQTSIRGIRTDVNDTVVTIYDADRNPITTTYPNPGTGSPVTQFEYDPDGRVRSTASKLGSNWMVSCTTYTGSGHVETSFGPYKVASPTDCSFGTNTAVPRITYGYDGADRLIMSTVAEPSGDRITKLNLYPDDQVQTQTLAFGTPAAATETYSYSNNGLPTSVIDSRGNISAQSYDGFDRVSLMQYPLAAGGGPSGSDVVAFSYDKRGGVVKRSIRGTSDVSASCTQCIAFSYDELARLKQKNVPTMAANTAVLPNIAAVPGYSIFYGYDLIGRLTSQGYNAGAPELSFAYDNAGRLTSSTQYGRTIGYSYGTPAQGIAQTMTWPSSAGMLLICTDALGRATKIKEAADCTTATGQLASYGYDDLSRSTAVIRPNGANTGYSYKDTGAVDTLTHTMAGGATVAYGFGYNRALQVTSRSTDNDLYGWTNHYNFTRDYTANGLDQYSQIQGDTQVSDTRGNLAAYRGSSWGYDAENRLATVNLPSGTVTTAYDPAGRLRQTGASSTTQFLYDGDELIAEYDASTGALVARYVPGVLSYDSAGAKGWYHSDALGSVIATSDGTGNAATINHTAPMASRG